MPVKPSGDLSMAADIAVEYLDDPDHSLSEFYGDSQSLPLSGEISFSDFFGTRRDAVVVYEMIGGGGAGGFGVTDGGSSGNAPSGFLSSISYDDIGANSSTVFTQVVAAGGAGGGNGQGPFGNGGLPGDSSIYGPGPAFRQPAINYGTGGYGGTGDNDGPDYDDAGRKGIGGSAGQYLTGTLQIPAGRLITVVVGSGGTAADRGHFSGGSGATGYVRLTIDGVVHEFTQNGTVQIPG